MIESELDQYLLIAPEVHDALREGKPVVALESAFISHGFAYPQNRDVALAAQAAVRAEGAVPATVAVRDGKIVVGLDANGVDELARNHDVIKAARPQLAYALAKGGWGSTTVSSTMIASAAAGIRTFATGGIGGIHRGAFAGFNGESASLDISADLDELARTEVVVVCAGPKCILDVPLTIEALETRGVPVVTVGGTRVPGYWASESAVPSPISVSTLAEASRIVSTHFAVGLGTGVLVCVPVPDAEALGAEALEQEIQAAIAEAAAAHLHGGAVTPWLLDRLAEKTGGKTIAATEAVIVNNAAMAARLGLALSGQGC